MGIPTEAQDVIRARLILSALREDEPVTSSEIEFVEGIVEHLIRTNSILTAEVKCIRLQEELHLRET